MKHIVVGVTGGIAAFKTCQLVSDLSKKYEVQVIMTENATNFVHPLTFETLTGRKCLIDTFDRNFNYEVEHISVAKWADVFVVAPATANVIAKFARKPCNTGKHGQAPFSGDASGGCSKRFPGMRRYRQGKNG